MSQRLTHDQYEQVAHGNLSNAQAHITAGLLDDIAMAVAVDGFGPPDTATWAGIVGSYDKLLDALGHGVSGGTR